MRYARGYPFHQEYADLAGEATTPPTEEPSTDEPPRTTDTDDADRRCGRCSGTADTTSGDDSMDTRPAGGGDEPPLWTTADDHVLHLPPDLVERILRGLVPAPQGIRRHRRLPRRVHRRRAITTVGNLVRRARRIGTSRARGLPLPIFRSRIGQRNVRIVARPRFGLRHEMSRSSPSSGKVRWRPSSRTAAVDPGTREDRSPVRAVAPARKLLAAADEASARARGVLPHS